MDRIFYKTAVSDMDLPIYVFDSSFLPPPETINYDELIPTLMTFLPSEPYILVMFCCGLNKISWIWGVKFLKKFLLDDRNLHNLSRVVTVHEGWFIKSLTGLLSNYHLTRQNLSLTKKLLENFNLTDKLQLKSSSLIVSCSNLTELAQYVDTNRIKISLNVYKYDYQLEGTRLVVFGVNSHLNPLESLKHHLYQTYNIIDTYGDKVELLFHRPGNKLSSEIFVDCIKRDQLMWINDWNLYCIATGYKKLVSELPTLIPVELIDLPLKNDTIQRNFTHIVDRLLYDLQVVLVSTFKLFDKLVKNLEVTKLSSKHLAKIFVHALSHEVYSKTNENNLIIVSSFIRKVIDCWDSLEKYKSMDMECLFYSGRDYTDENSYIDYDMTVDSDSEEEEVPELDISPKKILLSNQQVLNTASSFSSFGSVTTLKPMTSTDTLRQSLRKANSQITLTDKPSSPLKQVAVQYPPQKYHFSKPSIPNMKQVSIETQDLTSPPSPKFKPVIRGVKVGELAKLYEERTQGLELLRSL